jgi:hypothetical protein
MAQAGMLSRAEKAGMGGIAPQRGIAALEAALCMHTAELIAAEFNWARLLSGSNARLAELPMFAEVTGISESQQLGHASALLVRIKPTAVTAGRKRMVVVEEFGTAIKRTVESILGVDLQGAYCQLAA